MGNEIRLRYTKDDTKNIQEIFGDLGLNLDLSADFEIDGAQVSALAVTVSASGANDVLTPSASNKKIKIYKVLFSCDTDITGEVKLLWDGAGTSLGSLMNPKAGGEYLLLSTIPHFILGAVNTKLTINLAQAVASRVSCIYSETT